MNNKTIKRVFSFILIAIMLTVNITPSFAAVTHYVVEKNGANYQYAQEDLIESYYGDKELYNDYLNGDIKALLDDKNGYIDSEDVFRYIADTDEVHVNDYTESKEAKVIEVGDVVLVDGESGLVTKDQYAVLTKKAVTYTGRRGNILALDVIDGVGKKVSYDIVVADLVGDGDAEIPNNFGIDEEEIITGKAVIEQDGKQLLEIKTDKDGDVEEIYLLSGELLEINAKFEVDGNYIKTNGGDYRLKSSTVVFYGYDGTKYNEVITLDKAGRAFPEVDKGFVYEVDGEVEVILITETDADTDTKDVEGLVTGVKRTTNGKAQITLKVLGTTERFVTKDNLSADQVEKLDKDYTDRIAVLKVGETSNEIEGYALKAGTEIIIDRISGRTIYGDDVTVEVNSKAVIYDADLKEINLRDLKADDVITVYFEGSSRRFVDYVIAGETVEDDPAQVDYVSSDFNYGYMNFKPVMQPERQLFVITGFSEQGKEKSQTNVNLVIPKMVIIEEDGELVTKPVEGIDREAFKDIALKSVVFPETIGEYDFVINSSAFANAGLEEVIFNEGIKAIKEGAFTNNNLTEVYFPSTTLTIGNNSFAHNMISNLEFSDDVEAIQIDNYAFYDNELKEVHLPYSIFKFLGYVFKGNPGTEPLPKSELDANDPEGTGVVQFYTRNPEHLTSDTYIAPSKYHNIVNVAEGIDRTNLQNSNGARHLTY